MHFHPHEFKQELLGQEGLVPAAAVAVVMEGKVLLMKRVPHHGGDWVYPGGVLEPGDTFDVAARRETLEEAGIALDPQRNMLFPLATYITAPDIFGTRHYLLVYVSKYEADQTQPYLASPGEVCDWGWFDPQEVLEKVARGEMSVTHSGTFAIQRVKEYLSPEHTRLYGEVLMGGTFDRLHDGHKQLLAKAFEVGDYVYIGLTTDQYIQRRDKEFKEKIEAYEQRLANLRRYLDAQGLLNRAIILPLGDTAGPKALDPKLGAIVVSEETQDGGRFVNDLRIRNGIPPMDTIVVPLLRDAKGVISSTRLRQEQDKKVSG